MSAVMYYYIGGSWHAEKMPGPRKQHGELVRMPKSAPSPGAAATISANYACKKPPVEKVEYDEYHAYLLRFPEADGRIRDRWFAFHDSLGIDGTTPIAAVFEFFVEHYITHSVWGENL